MPFVDDQTLMNVVALFGEDAVKVVQVVLGRLKTRLRYEMNHEFYSCQTPRCKRYTFEEAIEFLFKCPTCHKPMTHLNNNRFMKVLTRRIEQIERELSG